MTLLATIDNTMWLQPTIRYQWVGEELTYGVDWLGASEVSSTEVLAYKNGEDVSADVLSGTTSESGATSILKKLSGIKGGERYVLSVKATVDGEVQIRAGIIIGKFRHDER